MTQQAAELHKERMQRTLAALERLWYLPGSSEEDIMFLANECGLKNEFYQLIKPHASRLASVG